MPLDQNIMNFDDILESDGQEFVVLPEGDYSFTVTSIDRCRFPGKGDIPPCNMARLTLRIDNDQGLATARLNLILYRTMEWKISAFFRAIGQKKHGEKVTMNWAKVQGARGRAHFKPYTYTRGSEEHQANGVDHFYDYDPSALLLEVKDADLPWGNGGF